jgi:hypothetical protein
LLTVFLEGARGLRRVTRNLSRGGGWFPLAEAIVARVESQLIFRLKMALWPSCEVQNHHVMEEE